MYNYTGRLEAMSSLIGGVVAVIVRFKARSNPLLTYGSECMCGRVSDNNDLSTVRLGPTEVELPAESRWLTY